MTKKALNFFKLPKIFYIGILPIIYLAIETGIYQAHENTIVKYVIEDHSRVTKLIPNIRIGVIHGILIFFILIILWFFLIRLFSTLNKDKTFAKRFFVLGEMSVDSIIEKLFYIGIVAVAFYAYTFRMFFSVIILGFIRPHNYYIGLFASIISYIITFAVILILWKVVCELLVVVFRCFEGYYQSKKKDMKE